MITAMRLLPIHLQSKCYPTNIKATMKQFYFYNMSFFVTMIVEGGFYMESREWERIVDHLLSLVPLFYRKFMLPGEFSSQRHMPPSHTQVLLLLHENGTLAVSEIGKRLAISRYLT